MNYIWFINISQHILEIFYLNSLGVSKFSERYLNKIEVIEIIIGPKIIPSIPKAINPPTNPMNTSGGEIVSLSLIRIGRTKLSTKLITNAP